MAMTMAMATASALSRPSVQTYLVTSSSPNPSHPLFQIRHSFTVRCKPGLSLAFLNSIDTRTNHVNINAIDNNLGIVTASRVKAFASVSPVAAAEGGGDKAVVAEEGEGGEEGKGIETLGLISEADLLRKKAKKILLRRKRLLRKRKLRKKGRWPPSKMAKNKNVYLDIEESLLQLYWQGFFDIPSKDYPPMWLSYRKISQEDAIFVWNNIEQGKLQDLERRILTSTLLESQAMAK